MSAAVATSADVAEGRPRRDWIRLPAVVFVITYAGLLLLVPSQLIVRQLGSPGTPANLWALGALVWWICATLGGLNPGRRLSPTRLAFMAVVVSVLASYAVGSANGWIAPADIRQATDELWTLVPVSITDLNEKMVLAANRGLLSMFGWTGIGLLAADGLRSWRDLHLVATWISWLGAVVAAIGAVQFFTGVNVASWFAIPGLSANADFGSVIARSVLNRVSSTAVHPIEFGVVMAGIFPLALHLSIFNARSIRTWIPTVLIGTAIPLSVSRSAILAMGVVLLVLILGWPARWRLRALFIAPVAVVALRVMIPGLVGTIQSLFTNLFNDPSIKGRTQDYAVVLRIYRMHPWFGRGLFTFVPRYYRILDNQFLMFLVELGVIGALSVTTLFVVSFYCARNARRHTQSLVNKDLALALSGSIAGLVLSYATFDAWGFPMAAGLTFLIIGLSGAAWQISRRETEHHPREAEPPARLQEGGVAR